MDATSLYFFVSRLESITDEVGPSVSFCRDEQNNVHCFISWHKLFVCAKGDGVYQALALAEEKWKLLLAQKESEYEQTRTNDPDDPNPPPVVVYGAECIGTE